MFLLATAFLTILLLFGVVTLQMRETKSERMTRHRLEAISRPRITLASGDWVEEYLNEQDPGEFAWLEEVLSDRRSLLGRQDKRSVVTCLQGRTERLHSFLGDEKNCRDSTSNWLLKPHRKSHPRPSTVEPA